VEDIGQHGMIIPYGQAIEGDKAIRQQGNKVKKGKRNLLIRERV
jgi:hypothetical protein